MLQYLYFRKIFRPSNRAILYEHPVACRYTKRDRLKEIQEKKKGERERKVNLYLVH